MQVENTSLSDSNTFIFKCLYFKFAPIAIAHAVSRTSSMFLRHHEVNNVPSGYVLLHK